MNKLKKMVPVLAFVLGTLKRTLPVFLSARLTPFKQPLPSNPDAGKVWPD